MVNFLPISSVTLSTFVPPSKIDVQVEDPVPTVALEEEVVEVTPKSTKQNTTPLTTEDDEIYEDALEETDEDFLDPEENVEETASKKEESTPATNPFSYDIDFKLEDEENSGWFSSAMNLVTDGFSVVKDNIMANKTVQNITAFSGSVVGNGLIQTGKTMIGENVGMMVGAAFPEAVVAYQVGKKLAENELNKTEKDQEILTDEGKSLLATGAGITAALTVTALSTGLSYLTGAPNEYGQALGYMVTAAGTIAGGITGLETAGQKVEAKEYVPRTAAYLVTAGAVGQVVGSGLTQTVAGLAAYNAPEVATLADKVIHRKPRPGNFYDPGKFVQNVVENAHGSSTAFSTSITEKLIQVPLIGSIVQMLLQYTIDKKVATNAVVRGLNEFAGIIKDPAVQQKIEEYKANPTSEKKELLMKEVGERVWNNYGVIEKGIAAVIQKNAASQIPTVASQLVDLMGTKEKELFGFELSDSKQTCALLEILLPSLIPLIGIHAKREMTKATDLTTEEVEKFYLTVSDVICAPYGDYKLVKGAQGLISTAAPFMQKYAQFIPAILSDKIGQSMVNPIITLDDDKEFDIPKADPKIQPASETKEDKPSFFKKVKTAIFIIKAFWSNSSFRAKAIPLIWNAVINFATLKFMKKSSSENPTPVQPEQKVKQPGRRKHRSDQ